MKIKNFIFVIIVLAVFDLKVLNIRSLAENEKLTGASYTLTSNTFLSRHISTGSAGFNCYVGIQDTQTAVLSSSSFSASIGFADAIYAEAALNPIITLIAPTSGYNIAPVHITKISGTNFSSGMSIKLAMTGEADIAAANVNIVSSSEVNCDFDIAGAKAGFWNVVVSKAGAESRLSNGFEIKSYTAPSNTAFNSPNPFDNTRETTKIVYSLDADADISIFIFSITGDLIYKDSCLAGVNGGKAGQNTVTWNGMSGFSELLSNGVYLLHVVEKNTGRTLSKGKIMIIRR